MFETYFQVLDEKGEWHFVTWNFCPINCILNGPFCYKLFVMGQKDKDGDEITFNQDDTDTRYLGWDDDTEEDKEIYDLFGFRRELRVFLTRNCWVESFDKHLKKCPEDTEIVEEFKGILEKYKDKVNKKFKPKIPLKYPNVHLDPKGFFGEDAEEIVKYVGREEIYGVLVEEDLKHLPDTDKCNALRKVFDELKKREKDVRLIYIVS